MVGPLIVMLAAATPMPPAVAQLIRAERRLDEACRGPGQDADGPICTRRDAAVKRIEAAGWCWGPDDADSEAERHWMRQGPRCRPYSE